MNTPQDWKRMEFCQFASHTAEKPRGTKKLQCIELEHIEPLTGRLKGWRDGYTNEVSKIAFRQNAILFGKLRPYLKKSWLATFDGMCSSELWVLQPDKDFCDGGWLHQLLLSELFSRATFASSGSKMPRADWSLVSVYPFDIPPLSEQKKISEILTMWDGALEKLDALIDAQERRKKGLMQQLLTGKRRFHAFAKMPWIKVRMNELLQRVFRPIDWAPNMVLSLVSLRRRCGGIFRRPDVLGSDYKTQDLHELRANDFLISKRQVAHGAWGFVAPQFAGSHVSKEYAILVNTSAEKLHMPFFAWLCQTPRMIRLSRVASTGVHIEKLIFDPEVFLRDFIRIPSDIEEQRQIAAVLDTADQQLNLLRAKRTAIDQQKRGLMQRLLTGKLRVKTLNLEKQN